MVGPVHSFESIQPVRVLDTRESALGGAAGMLAAGRVLEVPADTTIGADASAVMATVTAVDPCRDGFLTVYPGPCSDSPPLAATVNFVTGRTTANLAITALGAGDVCIFSSATTDVVVDVLGAVGPSGSRFNAITPARFVDSRGGTPIIPTISGRRVSHAPTAVPIAGRGEVPADATAVMVNVTAVQPDVPGFVSLYPGPCDGTVRTSTLEHDREARHRRGNDRRDRDGRHGVRPHVHGYRPRPRRAGVVRGHRIALSAADADPRARHPPRRLGAGLLVDPVERPCAAERGRRSSASTRVPPGGGLRCRHRHRDLELRAR